MTDLTCSRCSTLIAHVHDTRFGLAPAGSLCRPCSLPAFWPRRGGLLGRA